MELFPNYIISKINRHKEQKLHFAIKDKNYISSLNSETIVLLD